MLRRIIKNKNIKVEGLLQKNLSLPARQIKLKSGSVNYDPFSVYRYNYRQYLIKACNKKYGHDCLGAYQKMSYWQFLDKTGDALERFITQHKIETLVLGISGDLDSAFVIVSISKIIKEKNLPCKIVAYHFKNNFQPKRTRRIERLLHYLSEEFTPVTFFSYDVSTSSKLLYSEIEIFESGKIRPKTPLQIEQFNSVLNNLNLVSDISTKNITHTPIRERAPMMHELATAIRGRLLRNFPKCALIGSTNASEICLSNMTTSDVLVSFAPIAFLQKEVIARFFEEAMTLSKNKINPKDWKYTLNNPTPFYPSKLFYSWINENKISLRRETSHFPYLSEFEIEVNKFPQRSTFWEQFKSVNESFPVPGNTQYVFGRYIHHYLLDGLSEKKVQYFCKKFPEDEDVIKLSALLYLTARELTIKDTHIAKMYSIT
ncbi:MAG: hypothetical protein KGZ37_05135 [Nitrosarchaeum sp.]|nr:hypothetical protein [Nitrosarchaeum sp.]